MSSTDLEVPSTGELCGRCERSAVVVITEDLCGLWGDCTHEAGEPCDINRIPLCVTHDKTGYRFCVGMLYEGMPESTGDLAYVLVDGRPLIRNGPLPD